MQLHGSLQDLRQGDDTVTLYLQIANGLFDELVATDRLISLTDLSCMQMNKLMISKSEASSFPLI